MLARPTIRTATPDDIAEIVRVVNSAFTMELFLEGTRTDTERTTEMMEKGVFLVAEDAAQRMIGAVYVELRGERGYFGMLAVEPSLQRMGLGRMLVEASENYSREHGCTFMDLVVLSARTELPPYYHRLGYVETSTAEFLPNRPMKPGIECHKIIMSKAL